MVYAFVGAALLQYLAWRWVFAGALGGSDRATTAGTERVSIVVCFRNEAVNLPGCLRGILRQEHPAFEVIAVDDNSTDGSGAIVRELARTDARLRLIDPGPTRPGKKEALAAGIAAARHSILLLTDADCTPATPRWASLMTAPFAHGAQVVLGASPYRCRPGWLNWWQRFEATYTALQYLGFARRGEPYMGVGRNLAYRKSFFGAAGGFRGHADLPGGDDDLLVNAAALPESTVCVTDPAAYTYSHPSTDWPSYLRRKLRHQSVGPRYRLRHQLLLTGLAVSHGAFFLLGFCLLFTPCWAWALYIYVLRFSQVREAYSSGGAPHFLGGGAGAIKSGIRIALADALYAPFSLFLLAGSFLGRKKW